MQRYPLKFLTVLIFMILFLSSLILFFWLGDLRVNLTSSMPLGIWKLRDRGQMRETLRNQVVVFCPPDTDIFRKAKQQGILQAGSCKGSYRTLLKEVVGLPGDVVEYRNGIIINGQRIFNSRLQLVDFGFRQPQRLQVPEGSLWLMSSYSDLSFDSRYFGLVGFEQVLSTAEPLFVW